MSGQVRLIVAAELRHQIRSLRRDDQTFGLLVVLGLIALVATGLAVEWAFERGGAVAAGTAESPVGLAGTTLAVALAVVAVAVTLRTLQRSVAPTATSSLLAAVGHREAVLGVFGVEFVYVGVPVAVPLVAVWGAFGVGATSLPTVVGAVAAATGAVALGTGLGLSLGLGVRVAIRRSRLLARYKTVVAVAAVAGYVVVFATGSVTGAVRSVPAVVDTLGLTRLGDLAVVGLGTGSSRSGVLTAVAVAVGVSLTVVVCSVLAAELWYTTPPSPTVEAGRLLPFQLPGLDHQTRQVVRKSWRRARRSPVRLLYVAYVLLPLIAISSGTLSDGPPPVLAFVVAVYGGVATGATFTLNPIGEEGDALPVTLAAAVSDERYLRALWVAAALVGVVPTVVAAVGVGVLAGIDPTGLLFVGTIATGVAGLAPGLAVGIGTVFPRTEEANLTRVHEVVVPSVPALLLLFLAVGLLSLPFLTTTTAAGSLAAAVGLPPLVVRVGGLCASLLVFAAGAEVSFRVGVRRLGAYTVE